MMSTAPTPPTDGPIVVVPILQSTSMRTSIELPSSEVSAGAKARIGTGINASINNERATNDRLEPDSLTLLFLLDSPKEGVSFFRIALLMVLNQINIFAHGNPRSYHSQ